MQQNFETTGNIYENGKGISFAIGLSFIKFHFACTLVITECLHFLRTENVQIF